MKWLKGYTLIEILVGISIIGLLFTFGFVSFREFSRRQVIAGAVKELRGSLRLAQAQSLSGAKPSGCDPNSPLNGIRFSLVSDSGYEVKADCVGNVEGKTTTLSTGLTFTNPLPLTILFKPLAQGTSIGSGESVTLTIIQEGTNNTAEVIITDGGEIK